MKKTITAIATIFATILVVVGACGVAATHAAPRTAPLTYTCAVTPAASLPAACANVPGSWNDWAGRPTPARWDPCFARRDTTTMLYMQPCGPMNPTFAQWCTLHFDHHFMGVDVCHNKGQKIAR